MTMSISIDRCSAHGFYAICVNRGIGGKRLTPSKCCGSWSSELMRWTLTPDQIREIAADLIEAADREQPPVPA